MEAITLTIEGMHCEICVQRVERALMKLKGVEKVDTDLKNKATTIDGCPDIDEIQRVLEDLGFKVTNITREK